MNDPRVILSQGQAGWRVAPWNDSLGGEFETLERAYPGLDVVIEDETGVLGIAEAVVEDETGVLGIAEAVVDEAAALLIVVQWLQRARVTTNHDGTVGVASLANDSIVGTVPLPAAVPTDDRRAAWIASLRSQPKKPSAHVAIDGESNVCWIADGGAAAWVRQRLEREGAARRAELRQIHDGGEHFINPYTFVPLPNEVRRSAPRGHATMQGDGLSGWFDWVLTFVSPLALPHDMPAVQNECLVYPGSSLRGALRGLHEVIAHGCMRVLDADYVPVHREPMNVYRHDDFRLAVVEKVTADGVVRQVRLTEEPIWVLNSIIHAAISSADLRSGSRVTVDETDASRHKSLKRRELTTAGTVRPGGDWVVHITDVGARGKAKYLYSAVGKLTDVVVDVTEEQWNRWKAAARGTGDRVGEGDPPDTSQKGPGDPQWPGRMVQHPLGNPGRRRIVDSWLAVGDTVWLARPKDNGDLKMGVIWRSQGQHTVGARLPSPVGTSRTNAACTDPKDLCPTCQVFGSIDGQAGQGRQSGYASHIRVGYGVSSGPITSREEDIAPLRSPKPSSGGFYLRANEGTAPHYFSASMDENHVVRAHWGSRLDGDTNKPRPRQIRGRKFYWHGYTDRSDRPARQRPRAQDAEQLGTTKLVGPPLELRARVHFDNLTAEQLALLVAAAAPTVLFGEQQDLCVRLGGGKPFGFGSARAKVEVLHVFDAAARYAGGEKPSVDVADLLTKLRVTNDKEDDRAQVWEALAKVLALQAVPADRLWYPIAAKFQELSDAEAHHDQTKLKNIDKVFTWFGKNSGGRSGRLVELPEATNPNPYLASFGEA